MVLQPLGEITVILRPLVAVYYLSRRFEYAADRVAVDFTGDPEIAIRALANLHRVHEVPAQCDGFTELFMTHPPLAARVQAIARAGQIPECTFIHRLPEM